MHGAGFETEARPRMVEISVEGCLEPGQRLASAATAVTQK